MAEFHEVGVGPADLIRDIHETLTALHQQILLAVVNEYVVDLNQTLDREAIQSHQYNIGPNEILILITDFFLVIGLGLLRKINNYLICQFDSVDIELSHLDLVHFYLTKDLLNLGTGRDRPYIGE